MVNETEFTQPLRAGDEAAFEELFKCHFLPLCQYANHFIKDKTLSEEIVEDFFCWLWENSETISITASLRAYLFRSIHNKCMKHLRHAAVEQKYRETVNYSLLDQELHQPQSAHYPLANLIAKELGVAIEKAIDGLPNQCKEIFLLHRNKELSYPEIAKKTGLSVNTIKTQMSRALKKLRTELKDYLPLLLWYFIYR